DCEWSARLVDGGEGGAQLQGVAVGDEERGEDSGYGSGDLGVHLFRGHLEQALALFHLLADLLVPDGDGPFLHRLAELGHDDVHQPDVLRTVSTIRATAGMTLSSRASAPGSGP